MFQMERNSHARDSLEVVLFPKKNNVGPVRPCFALPFVVVWVCIRTSPPDEKEAVVTCMHSFRLPSVHTG